MKVTGNNPLNAPEEENRGQVEVNENRVEWRLDADERRERTGEHKKGGGDGKIPSAPDIEQYSVKFICFHTVSFVVKTLCTRTV